MAEQVIHGAYTQKRVGKATVAARMFWEPLPVSLRIVNWIDIERQNSKPSKAIQAKKDS
jgi:hypothetical protein